MDKPAGDVDIRVTACFVSQPFWPVELGNTERNSEFFNSYIIQQWGLNDQKVLPNNKKIMWRYIKKEKPGTKTPTSSKAKRN